MTKMQSQLQPTMMMPYYGVVETILRTTQLGWKWTIVALCVPCQNDKNTLTIIAVQ